MGGGRPLTVAEYVADVLRRGIIQGELPSGAELRQEDVAAQLNVSRMPVREALRMLQSEGWVVVEPRRGAVVASVEPGDIRETFQLRADMEQAALRRSIPLLTDERLRDAATLLDRMDRASSLDDYLSLHKKFHLALTVGAGRRYTGLISELIDLSDRYLRLELTTLANHDESQAEHRAILEACRLGKIDEAIAQIGPHIAEAGDDLARTLESKKA
ncbi:GntR family transcriptional regulator [Mesorhizobium sp. INR15]|uniref:GntR family transcriptional regulator n=1 Tax=Mesorhizobium sp. INR15 TaxID=2654248 RepID=UPI002155FDB4|nr:GntR family transcriptional regulator [Mesorhizobium sp. INR15]